MASTITYMIPGAHLMNQLAETSNPRDDCVFTSCALLVGMLTGKATTGTAIKAADNNYGPKYVGFASAGNLVDTLDKLGVILTRRGSSTQSGLVALLRTFVASGAPCLVTMPSQWNSAVSVRGYNPRTYTGYMHVGVACGLGPGMIRVMNPWGGWWQDGSDSYWAQRLLTGDIWVGTRKPTPPVVQAAPAPAQGQGAASGAPLLTAVQYQAKIAAAIKALS